MAGWPNSHPQADRVAGLKAEYFFDQGTSFIDTSDFTGPADIQTTHSRTFVGVPDATHSNLVGTASVGLLDPIAVSHVDDAGQVATEHLDKLAIRMTAQFEITADTAGEVSFFTYKEQ